MFARFLPLDLLCRRRRRDGYCARGRRALESVLRPGRLVRGLGRSRRRRRLWLGVRIVPFSSLVGRLMGLCVCEREVWKVEMDCDDDGGYFFWEGFLHGNGLLVELLEVAVVLNGRLGRWEGSDSCGCYCKRCRINLNTLILYTIVLTLGWVHYFANIVI